MCRQFITRWMQSLRFKYQESLIEKSANIDYDWSPQEQRFYSRRQQSETLRNKNDRAAGPNDPLENEEPLLLHPCHDDPRPEERLEFLGEGIVREAIVDGSASDYGRATIEVCGLLREGLVKARRETYLLLLERFQILFVLRDLMLASANNPAALETIRLQVAHTLELLNKMVEPREPYTCMVSQLLPRLRDMHDQGLSWAQALVKLHPGPITNAAAGQAP